MLWKFFATVARERQYLDFLAQVLPPKNLSSSFETASTAKPGISQDRFYICFLLVNWQCHLRLLPLLSIKNLGMKEEEQVIVE